MRRVILLVGCFCVSVSAVDERTSSEPTWNISTNLFGPVLGEYGLSVSRRLGQWAAVGLTGAYEHPSVTNGNASASGFGVGAEGVLYFTGSAFSDSIISAVSAGFEKLSVSDASGGGGSASTSFLAVTAIGGYQWVWSSGLNLTLGVGVRYLSAPSSLLLSNGQIAFFRTGVRPAAAVTVGYAFLSSSTPRF